MTRIGELERDFREVGHAVIAKWLVDKWNRIEADWAASAIVRADWRVGDT